MSEVIKHGKFKSYIESIKLGINHDKSSSKVFKRVDFPSLSIAVFDYQRVLTVTGVPHF